MDDVLRSFILTKKYDLLNLFFENLKPTENSLQAVSFLNSIKQFSVYILTVPSVRNPTYPL